jgi:hypothetical protein
MMLMVLVALLFLPDSSSGIELPNALVEWPCYEVGMPVPVLFQYNGGIKDWDGIISLGGLSEPNKLAVVNGCFLVVSRGLGDFRQPTVEPGVKRPHWQTFKAIRGELVSPIGGGPDFYCATVGFREPFSTIVNLSEHYELKTPGVYTVHWGIQGLCEAVIIFEILPKGSLESTMAAAQKRYEVRK